MSAVRALVWLIATAAFLLGFSALSDVANQVGIFPTPYGGWLFAIAVDGFIGAGSLAYASSRSRWFPLLVVTLGLGASIAFQVVHAAAAPEVPGVPGWLPEAVAVVPPLALLGALETERHLRQHGRSRNTTNTVEHDPDPAEHPAPGPSGPPGGGRPVGGAGQPPAELERPVVNPAGDHRDILEEHPVASMGAPDRPGVLDLAEQRTAREGSPVPTKKERIVALLEQGHPVAMVAGEVGASARYVAMVQRGER